MGRAGANHLNTGFLQDFNTTVTFTGSSFTNEAGGVVGGQGTLNTAGLTFANRGVYKAPEIVTRVERVDQDGNPTVAYERQVTQRQVLSPEQADLVTHALQGPLDDGGTGHRANLGKPAAGKTGTAQHNWDAWFAGYVPKLTAVVWMGYPQGSIPMENIEGFSTVTGGSLPIAAAGS